MENTVIKTKKTLIIALAWVMSILVTCGATSRVTVLLTMQEPEQSIQPPSPTVSELYTLAMQDSVFADADEIHPLVEITRDSDMVTWDADGTRVLMLSWHRYPESYTAGESFVCEYGEIWTFTDREILNWYQNNHEGVDDWELRLEQLIGLPEEKAYTHVSAFWVEPDELIRPAYQTDITAQVSAEMLDGSALGAYKSWFDGNTVWSYFDSAYPWTRLGYTYDWSNGESEYGLSEFIILPNSEIEVEWTVTTEQFLEKLSTGVTVEE